MKSFQTLFRIVETAALSILLIFLTGVFYYFHIHIKQQFIKSQSLNIEAVDLIVKDIVSRSMLEFKSGFSLPHYEEALSSLVDLSDIYLLDNSYRISRLIKKDLHSKVFVGFDFSSSSIRPFLSALVPMNIEHSPIVTSVENEDLSFYIGIKTNNGILLGRIELARILSNLSKSIIHPDNIIIIAEKNGYVLASSRPNLHLNVLPEQTKQEIYIDSSGYLIIRKPSSVFNNDLAVLTPLSHVFSILQTLWFFFAIFALLSIIIIIIKIAYQTMSLIKPLGSFAAHVKDWNIERNNQNIPRQFSHFEEIKALYKIFADKSLQISNLVTTVKQNEQAINQIRLYLENIINSMPSALVAVDKALQVKEWNLAAISLTGGSAKEAIGSHIFEVMPFLKKYEHNFEEVITSNTPQLLSKQLIKHGKDLYFDISIFPLSQDGSNEVAIRLDDVTDMEKTEQHLRQAQKLDAIGTLVGGFAHDFNNILTGIVGTLSLMKFLSEKPEGIPSTKLADLINTMNKSAERAANMVKQMLTLAKKQDLTFEPVDLIDVIKHVIKICDNTFDKRVEFSCNLPDHPAIVEADFVQLEQVLLNLAINSMHALTIMKKSDESLGGTINISLRKIYADIYFCHKHATALADTDYWALRFEDDGVGIAEENISKIFDPFFSTKPKESGTGLGLTMVHNIINQHRGFIDIYSKVGEGTVINIFIPASEFQSDIKEKSDKHSIPVGTGTILIIDDEEQVRTIAASMLENCGYSVIIAEDGIDGINKYQEHREEIDIVILDINLPKMAGNEVLFQLKQISPDIKVIIISGFIHDSKSASLIEMGAKQFLQKPFTLKDLSQVVANVSVMN